MGLEPTTPACKGENRAFVTMACFAKAMVKGVRGVLVGAFHAAFEAGNGIQLGLDVAWDVFIGLGTPLLALNMWRHRGSVGRSLPRAASSRSQSSPSTWARSGSRRATPGGSTSGRSSGCGTWSSASSWRGPGPWVGARVAGPIGDLAFGDLQPHDLDLPGGDDGTRTHDPLLAKQVLFQLSYVPVSQRCACSVSHP
jgi:hypothetical protein